MIPLFLALSLLATAPTLIPSPPAEKKILGANHYGSETIENVEGFGLIRLNGTKVTDSLHVTGSLISNNAQINSLEIIGEANFTDTIIKNGGTITGYIQAHKSEIQKPIAITSQKAVFVACKLQGITMHQGAGYKAKQILELKQGTIVDGPIAFESGKGEVHLYSGSQVLGPITGGKVIKKY